MNEVKIGKRTTMTPVEWNQLTDKQLVAISSMYVQMLSAMKQQRPPAYMSELARELEIRALRSFLGITWRTVMVRLTAEDIYDLRSISSWLLDPTIKLTETKLLSFTHRFKRYHGPADHLGNLVAVEFSFCEFYYRRYLNLGNEDYLDHLVAILYRPKAENYNPNSPDTSGDIREKFNKYTYMDRARKMKKVSSGIKAAVLLQYWGAREEQMNNHSHVFSKDNKKKGSTQGYGDLLLELSGDKFGTVEQTEQTNIIKLFAYLELMLKRADEAERIRKQKKRHNG